MHHIRPVNKQFILRLNNLDIVQNLDVFQLSYDFALDRFNYNRDQFEFKIFLFLLYFKYFILIFCLNMYMCMYDIVLMQMAYDS